MTTSLDKLNLQPQERRWIAAIVVAVVVVLNYTLVWPYFSEWSKVRKDIDTATQTTQIYKREIDNNKTIYEPKLKSLEENKTAAIVLDSGDIQLQKAIMAKTSSSFMPNSYSPQHSKLNLNTNQAQFFDEQSMKITVDCEEKPLVDFLYDIGGDNSMIRVRELILRPLDQNRYKLNATIVLSASYQKKPEVKPATPAPTKPGLAKPGLTKPATGSKPAAPGAKPTAPARAGK
jgi:hypothetical protein